jgi:hypothetical protein
MRAGARLSPVRLVAVVSTLTMLYSLARVAVLFFESLSIVRSERQEDLELIDACRNGVARGSTKMREACLKARADLASPVVFKAIVKAVSTAFRDFADSIGSPLKLAAVLLFLLCSVTMPIVPWARLLLGQPHGAGLALQPHDDGDGHVHYISYAPGSDAPPAAGKLRRRLARAIRKLRRGGHDAYHSHDDDDDQPRVAFVDPNLGDDLEPGCARRRSSGGGAAAWHEVDLGKKTD